MRFVCISDTHFTDENLDQLEVPNGDVLIHAGDATFAGRPDECMRFLAWMRRQPHRIKIFVPGNHDFWFESNATWPVDDGVKVLVNGFYTFVLGSRVFNVLGMSYCHNLPTWAFSAEDEQIERWLRARAHMNVDILVTHMPPYGIMDSYQVGHHHGRIESQPLGSIDVRAFVETTKPLLHVFGHIHDAYGAEVHGPTQFVNAAQLGEDYKPWANKPIVVEV